MRRIQQSVDQSFPSPWLVVCEEGIHLLRRRRKADEIKVGASREGSSIRFWSRLDLCGFQLGQNEPIDIVPAPRAVLDVRRVDRGHRNVCPVLAPLSRRIPPRIRSRFDWRDQLLPPRIRRSDLDPLSDIRDLLIGKAPPRRHGELLVRITDRRKKRAAIGITGNDGDAGLTAGQSARGMREIKIALEGSSILAVTFETVFDKDRPDLTLEEFEPDCIDLDLERVIVGLGPRGVGPRGGSNPGCRRHEPTSQRDGQRRAETCTHPGRLVF